MARALYDNIAESPDELAFRKGDYLVVLEQNTAGLEGWWLCSLRGRQVSCYLNIFSNSYSRKHRTKYQLPSVSNPRTNLLLPWQLNKWTHASSGMTGNF